MSKYINRKQTLVSREKVKQVLRDSTDDRSLNAVLIKRGLMNCDPLAVVSFKQWLPQSKMSVRFNKSPQLVHMIKHREFEIEDIRRTLWNFMFLNVSY